MALRIFSCFVVQTILRCLVYLRTPPNSYIQLLYFPTWHSKRRVAVKNMMLVTLCSICTAPNHATKTCLLGRMIVQNNLALLEVFMDHLNEDTTHSLVQGLKYAQAHLIEVSCKLWICDCHFHCRSHKRWRRNVSMTKFLTNTVQRPMRIVRRKTKGANCCTRFN